jgi:hypothetical protein
MHVLIPQTAPVVAGGERYPAPPSTDFDESPPPAARRQSKRMIMRLARLKSMTGRTEASREPGIMV